jgi:hypothetical protein
MIAGSEMKLKIRTAVVITYWLGGSITQFKDSDIWAWSISGLVATTGEPKY